MTPTLANLDALVSLVASQDVTPEHALAVLRARGQTPDREALADAVAAIQLRDQFAGRLGDPVAFTGVDFRPGVSVWDLAVELCEDQLSSALRVLAVRSVEAVSA